MRRCEHLTSAQKLLASNFGFRLLSLAKADPFSVLTNVIKHSSDFCRSKVLSSFSLHYRLNLHGETESLEWHPTKTEFPIHDFTYRKNYAV
jgi:hypothetical protein